MRAGHVKKRELARHADLAISMWLLVMVRDLRHEGFLYTIYILSPRLRIAMRTCMLIISRRLSCATIDHFWKANCELGRQ